MLVMSFFSLLKRRIYIGFNFYHRPLGTVYSHRYSWWPNRYSHVLTTYPTMQRAIHQLPGLEVKSRNVPVFVNRCVSKQFIWKEKVGFM